MAGFPGGGADGRAGSNGHGPGPNGDRRFDELDALSDEDLELLVGRVEDEDELRDLIESGRDDDLESAEGAERPSAGARPGRRGHEERPGLVALRLFPDEEYQPVPGPWSDRDDEPAIVEDDGAGGAAGTGDGLRHGIARARYLLTPVERALRAEGFYAYGTLDDENRWIIAVDDEAGRVDVRLGPDGFVLDLRATSPGLYADVEHPFRRRRLERAAQYALPRVARGHLEPYQATEWDEVDQGIAVTIRYAVPLSRADEVGRIVRRHLPELDELLALVEDRVTD